MFDVRGGGTDDDDGLRCRRTHGIGGGASGRHGGCDERRPGTPVWTRVVVARTLSDVRIRGVRLVQHGEELSRRQRPADDGGGGGGGHFGFGHGEAAAFRVRAYVQALRDCRDALRRPTLRLRVGGVSLGISSLKGSRAEIRSGERPEKGMAFAVVPARACPSPCR